MFYTLTILSSFFLFFDSEKAFIALKTPSLFFEHLAVSIVWLSLCRGEMKFFKKIMSFSGFQEIYESL